MLRESIEKWKQLVLKLYLKIEHQVDNGAFFEAKEALISGGLLNEDGTENRNYVSSSNSEDSRIYVGNLPWGIQESDLSIFFSEFGEVKSVSIITDRDTGRSRGFAFVEFKVVDSARKSLEANGKDFQGRALKISFANRRDSKPSSYEGSGLKRRRYNNNDSFDDRR